MTYVVTGLPAEIFQPLFDLDEAALTARATVRYVADSPTGFPCRVSLAHAEPGERVLLLNHEHHAAATPYRSSHAIFVREAATRTARLTDALPAVLLSRLLSVRAFDAAGMMVDAEVVEGEALEPLIDLWLARPQVACLHAHTARRGCYLARIQRE